MLAFVCYVTSLITVPPPDFEEWHRLPATKECWKQYYAACAVHHDLDKEIERYPSRAHLHQLDRDRAVALEQWWLRAGWARTYGSTDTPLMAHHAVKTMSWLRSEIGQEDWWLGEWPWVTAPPPRDQWQAYEEETSHDDGEKGDCGAECIPGPKP